MFDFLNLNIEKPQDILKFYQKMDSRTVRKEITDKGDVIVIAVTSVGLKGESEFDEFANEPEDDKDNSQKPNPGNIIKVVGCIF